MAASKAPNNTTIVSSAPSSTITNNNIVGHNFHELCRSCGKTNAELYDLFQTTNSPFSTSSTTCYTHLNNSSSTSLTLTSTLATATSTATNTATTNTTPTTLTTSTAAVCAQNSSFPQTFDSVAATAKATAKGQSNMDNILQEMQIWQLLIKCNDGLPQRICAKCTAQFYMIHKFRRKCLKVQTQLRALYEEKQKFYERQQQNEKNVTVKDATIEATSTPASPVVVTQPEALLVDIVKPPAVVMHKVNDLVNDNSSEIQQQETIVDNTKTNTKLSVSFEANTGNTNDFIATTIATTTILPNNVETMQQKTEANEPTPTSSASVPVPAPAPAFIDNKTFEAGQTHENCMVTTTGHKLKLKDEKIPLLRPAVLLDSKRSPPLTLQQPLEQICDNDTTTTIDQTTNPSKKPCFDQETSVDTHDKHLIFKSNIKQNDIEQCQKKDEDRNENEEKVEKLNVKQKTQNTDNTDNTDNTSSSSLKNSSTLLPVLIETETKTETSDMKKLCEEMSLQKDCVLSKINSESLFVTKAALKAYTIPPPSTSAETKNRDHQKPITNSEASCDIKNANDNNNNSHKNIYSHRYDNQIELNDDNICSSTSYSTPSSSTSSYSLSSSFSRSRKQQRANISKRKIIKYANKHNRRPGHCYKSNLKTAQAVAVAAVAAPPTTTKMMARTTIQKYGRKMIVKSKKRSRRINRNKLKRLFKTKAKTSTTSTASTSSSTSSSSSSTIIQKKRQQQKLKMSHKKSLKQKQQQQQRDIQMEDEMSSTAFSTTSSASTSPTSSASASSVSAAISSTSLPLRATTPAVTDLVRNVFKENSYCKNTNKNMNNKKGNSSSADRLSSNNSNSCIMWKTKAAMKANANDMPVEVADSHIDGEPTSNIPEISLPYTATTATETMSTGSIPFMSTTLATDTDSVEEDRRAKDKSSKNFDENQGNNNLMERNSCIQNKIMSMTSGGNEVKDDTTIKDESENFQKAQIFKNNLWPEEADEQQVDNKQQKTQAIECIKSERENISQEMEKIKNDDELKKPNKIGGMKLIIQRKRGARFKCRRKDDDETAIMHDNHEPTTAKRKKKSSHISHQTNKLEMPSSSFSIDGNDATKKDKEVISNNNNKDTIRDFDNSPSTSASQANEDKTQPQDENKENPLSAVNTYEFDSDSNVSVYRDPLLLRNEMLEEDTHLTDLSKTQLSLQTECTKEMYKLYKEKANFESPKKLIVRVPLTSLTQDFKKLHLTMEDQENENTNANKTVNDEEYSLVNTDEQETNEETLSVAVTNKQEDTPLEQENCLQANISSSQSDLLGFSQNTESSALSGTENSSQPIIEMMRYIEPPLCSASSKINDFINDFQNNCIDSSEIDDTCDMIPTLVPGIAQELSDEIRDVEDTLNGILSEMHDKDMYTPRSGETDEFFTHSVYSPLTDSPTTPSQSFYAESPCTINSNPMSVSPFIHHNMDYNAMTPQSNHSSMGLSSSYMSSAGGSTGPHTSVYSEHYPAYNECYEETTQSELIGFQNDIPCFENIEIANSNELQAETTEEIETVNATDNGNNIITVTSPDCENNNAEEIATAEYVNAETTQAHIDTLPEVTADIQQQQQPPPTQQNHYSPANYQPLHNAPTLHIPKAAATPLIANSTMTQPHYIVTNTNQGPILFANSHLSLGREHIEPSFKPHNNNLQFVTLGQAMEANPAHTANQLINNNATKLNWPTSVNTVPNFNQQPVLTTANGTTTTYFINANGELYQANIPTANLQNPTVNTIFVPTTSTQNSNKTNPIDNSDNNYMQAMQQQQQHQQQQQQHAQQQNNGHSSQYIMLLNNLGGSPRYYATTNLSQTIAAPTQQQHISTPTTVLFHPAQGGQNLQNNKNNNSNTNQQNILATNQNQPQLIKSTPVPITPALEQPTDATAGQTLRQRVNQQLQKQIKQRQLQNLQPKTTPQNVTQKITLVCRFCHKRPKFKNNVDYSNHIINTHPAEKPYNCPHCPMHFCRRSERQTHVAQVHGSRYQCAQCGLSFCAQRTLDFHLQKHHANLGRSHHQQPPQQQQQQLQQQKQQQQNSSLTIVPATYQLLQNNQQQRLVRVEDVHVQVTGENKNKRSIDLTLDAGECDGASAVGVDIKTSQSINEVEILSHTMGTQQLQQQQQQQQQLQLQRQQSRKLCCPDCNGDDDDCCGNNQNDEQNNNHNNNSNNIIQTAYNAQEYAGNESVNNYLQQHPPHVTIPSPEQTEPDSTTTLRHFRKRQLCEVSPHFLSASPSSSSSSSSSSTSSSSSLPAIHNNGGHDNINLNHNSPDNIMAGDGGSGNGGGEQIVVVERSLRASHNCLLCEESFTNEIALRKHHHLAHGAATQLTACSSATTTTTAAAAATSMAFVCTICRRGFRMRNALQRHMETHDAEGRPYECNICQVRFPRPSQLTLHKLTVHKFEKPNSCRECGKQFGTESAMKAHAVEHEHEAARAKTTSTTEATTSASASSSSKSQLSSRFYLETTSTTEQIINLQTTTSGVDASVSASTNSNDALNNATQNVIVSGLVS